jgi:SAM-dependent methyltransferase
MDLIRQAYATKAREYVELFGSSDKVHADDLSLIEHYLSLRPGAVLDIGSGPGHLTEYLRTLNVDACGIDLVPQFIDHARNTYPDGRYELGSFRQLAVANGSVFGILAWYSLIHVPPEDLAGVLVELRRVTANGATLVIGFFDGDRLESFEHAVATAYYWPVDQLAAQLQDAGFIEIERLQRPGVNEPGRRPHAVLVARAT